MDNLNFHTRKQWADFYKISLPFFNKKIKEIGITKAYHHLSPADNAKIFAAFGNSWAKRKYSKAIHQG